MEKQFICSNKRKNKTNKNKTTRNMQSECEGNRTKLEKEEKYAIFFGRRLTTITMSK